MRFYSKAQLDYIRTHVAGRSYAALARMFTRKFGVPRTADEMRRAAGRRGWNNGSDGRFKPGHKTHNKGKPRWWASSTEFAVGHTPKQHRPVGSVRVDVNGYTLIKIGEPRRWKMKHVLVWEKAHGPVPRGHIIIFGDKDKTNFDVNNLVCVSRREFAIMNQRGLVYSNAELTRTGKIIADIILKKGERAKNVSRRKVRK